MIRIGCLDDFIAQVAPNGVSGDAQTSGHLPDWDLVTQVPASNNSELRHVDYSKTPAQLPEQDYVLYVSQFSAQINRP
jgi:hypothetical protein